MDDVVLRLGDEPDAVPRARRFVAAHLRGQGLANLVEDAAIAATELVTNGILHAGPPVTVRVRIRYGGVRIEVADPSPAGLVAGQPRPHAMTGRGLALVSAVTSRWGVSASAEGNGKVVWCELALGGERGHRDPPTGGDTRYPDGRVPERRTPGGNNPPGDGASGRPPTRHIPSGKPPGGNPHPGNPVPDGVTGGEPRFIVRLGDVPTDLLLAAKEHVENLVREFTLASAGAAGGSTAAVPGPLAELIETVVSRFAEPRQAIRRQAVAAAARGAPRTTLTLRLPASTADVAEQYLAALDVADAYARASRLLTLETPPQHRVFRRWYIESLVEQLRRAARAEEPGPTPTFEWRRLDEFGAATDSR